MDSKSPEWLGEEFLEKALRESEKDDSIRVVDISVKGATDKGDNYTSDMYRATVNFTRNREDREITEQKSIIVKVAPTDQREQLIASLGYFEKEALMMSDTLVKMTRLLGSETTPFGPRSLLTQLEKPKYIVMEDLTPLGFKMADRQAGLDLDHSLLAIRAIAKFHASSVALIEKNPENAKEYGKGMFSKDAPASSKKYFTSNIMALGKEVATWSELGPRYAEKIINLSIKIYDKAAHAQTMRKDDFNVLNHGDCWVNNMLFRYDDQGKPIEQIFVDFQLSVYTSPAIDLLYFLTLSPSEEVFMNNRELLLREYQNLLATTMSQLGCDTPAPSYEELKRSLKERVAYGMVVAFIVAPIILVDKSDVKNIADTVEQNNANNPNHRGSIYRNLMLRLLPLYEKMGLLDE